MKKHYGLILILVTLISIGWTVCSQAIDLMPVTSFDSTWEMISYESAGTGTLTIDGNTINLFVQGSQDGAIDKNLQKNNSSGIVGMAATIRVDTASNSSGGRCLIGLYQWIGQINNKKIQMMISLNQEDNKKFIRYRVRSVDLFTNESKVITWGTFGDRDGGWQIGESKTVVFARVGSEFCFYVAGEPGLVKIQALDEITSYTGPGSSPAVSAWADQGLGNSISGSVSDIYLIHE